MNPIVEISEEVILLPIEILHSIKLGTRFVVEVNDGTLILRPENKPQPFWATATPKERAENFRQWALSHTDGPGLPDEALHRENIYD